MKGWSTRSVLALCPCARTRVQAVRRLFNEETGQTLQIIETARDMERQRHYVDIGVSKPATLIPGPHRGAHLTADGGIPEPTSAARVLACDLAPRAYLGEWSWNPTGGLWTRYGRLARAEGLLWGGDWDGGWDKPHVYLRKCQCADSASPSA